MFQQGAGTEGGGLEYKLVNEDTFTEEEVTGH